MSALPVWRAIEGGHVSDLPAKAAHQARRCLLDLIGVAAAGSTTDLSAIIRRHAATQFGAGDGKAASLIFDPNGRGASAAGAALANGMTIDAFDAHDGHPLTKGHAGCGLFPALLALAEIEAPDMPLGGVLFHMANGYEIAIRCGIALHETVSDYHTSGAWVAVGIAAAGGRMLGMDDATIRHSIGIAEYHGPRSQMMRVIDHPTMLKDGSGWGAMAGVSALMLAGDGFTGAPALTVEADNVRPLFDDLGTRWRINEQYFKPWPVCRWGQPAVQAALDLKAAHRFEADAIAAVEITTFHEGVRLAGATPSNTEESQYAVAFPVAVALVYGTIGPEHISLEGLADEAVLVIARAIILTEHDSYNARFPAERWAHVTITLKDGTELVSEPTTASGDAHMPLDDDALVVKFHALMESAGYAEWAAPLEDMIMSDSGATVAELVSLLAVRPD